MDGIPVPAPARSSRGASCSRRHCFDTRMGRDMVPRRSRVQVEFAGQCIRVGPEYPARTITVGAWHALNYVGTGDTPTGRHRRRFEHAVLHGASLDVDYSARIRMQSAFRTAPVVSDITCGKTFTIWDGIRGWPDRPHGHLRRC